MHGYKIRLEEIDKAIETLRKEREEIVEIVSSVDGSELGINHGVVHSFTEDNGYSNNMSWFAKAKFILKKAGKPLTTSQIVDEILSYEQGIERNLATRNISSILGVKSNEGKEIDRFKIEGKDQKFGLK